MNLAGSRRRHLFADADRGTREQWDGFEALLRGIARVDELAYGVLCGADEAGFEYMCGVEVPSFAGLAAEVGRMRVPEQRYAVFAHPDGTPPGSTWMAVFEWLDSSGFVSAHTPDFEVYRSVQDARARSGAEIWLGVRER